MKKEKSLETLSKCSDEFFKTINKTCLPKIDSVSVPILGIQNDEIKHDRTGILYQISDEHFVITAAHDLHQIVKANIHLYLSMNKSGVMPLPLDSKALFYSTETEIIDIAVIWLPPHTAHEIVKYKKFLSHNQIDLNGSKSRGPFVFFGYPMDWSGQKVSRDYLASQGLVFVTLPHGGRLHETAHYDKNIHMVLHYSPEAINVSQGEKEILPKLYGISGCGIWQVGDITEIEVTARNEESLTLVGIQHTWFKNLNYIQATKIGYAMSLIVENNPATKPAMEIVYPKHR